MAHGQNYFFTFAEFIFEGGSVANHCL